MSVINAATTSNDPYNFLLCNEQRQQVSMVCAASERCMTQNARQYMIVEQNFECVIRREISDLTK